MSRTFRSYQLQSAQAVATLRQPCNDRRSILASITDRELAWHATRDPEVLALLTR